MSALEKYIEQISELLSVFREDQVSMSPLEEVRQFWAYYLFIGKPALHNKHFFSVFHPELSLSFSHMSMEDEEGEEYKLGDDEPTEIKKAYIASFFDYLNTIEQHAHLVVPYESFQLSSLEELACLNDHFLSGGYFPFERIEIDLPSLAESGMYKALAVLSENLSRSHLTVDVMCNGKTHVLLFETLLDVARKEKQSGRFLFENIHSDDSDSHNSLMSHMLEVRQSLPLKSQLGPDLPAERKQVQEVQRSLDKIDSPDEIRPVKLDFVQLSVGVQLDQEVEGEVANAVAVGQGHSFSGETENLITYHALEKKGTDTYFLTRWCEAFSDGYYQYAIKYLTPSALRIFQDFEFIMRLGVVTDSLPVGMHLMRHPQDSHFYVLDYNPLQAPQQSQQITPFNPKFIRRKKTRLNTFGVSDSSLSVSFSDWQSQEMVDIVSEYGFERATVLLNVLTCMKDQDFEVEFLVQSGRYREQFMTPRGFAMLEKLNEMLSASSDSDFIAVLKLIFNKHLTLENWQNVFLVDVFDALCAFVAEGLPLRRVDFKHLYAGNGDVILFLGRLRQYHLLAESGHIDFNVQHGFFVCHHGIELVKNAEVYYNTNDQSIGVTSLAEKQYFHKVGLNRPENFKPSFRWLCDLALIVTREGGQTFKEAEPIVFNSQDMQYHAISLLSLKGLYGVAALLKYHLWFNSVQRYGLKIYSRDLVYDGFELLLPIDVATQTGQKNLLTSFTKCPAWLLAQLRKGDTLNVNVFEALYSKINSLPSPHISKESAYGLLLALQGLYDEQETPESKSSLGSDDAWHSLFDDMLNSPYRSVALAGFAKLYRTKNQFSEKDVSEFVNSFKRLCALFPSTEDQAYWVNILGMVSLSTSHYSMLWANFFEAVDTLNCKKSGEVSSVLRSLAMFSPASGQVIEFNLIIASLYLALNDSAQSIVERCKSMLRCDIDDSPFIQQEIQSSFDWQGAVRQFNCKIESIESEIPSSMPCRGMIVSSLSGLVLDESQFAMVDSRQSYLNDWGSRIEAVFNNPFLSMFKGKLLDQLNQSLIASIKSEAGDYVYGNPKLKPVYDKMTVKGVSNFKRLGETFERMVGDAEFLCPCLEKIDELNERYGDNVLLDQLSQRECYFDSTDIARLDVFFDQVSDRYLKCPSELMAKVFHASLAMNQSLVFDLVRDLFGIEDLRDEQILMVLKRVHHDVVETKKVKAFVILLPCLSSIEREKALAFIDVYPQALSDIDSLVQRKESRCVLNHIDEIKADRLTELNHFLLPRDFNKAWVLIGIAVAKTQISFDTIPDMDDSERNQLAQVCQFKPLPPQAFLQRYFNETDSTSRLTMLNKYEQNPFAIDRESHYITDPTLSQKVHQMFSIEKNTRVSHPGDILDGVLYVSAVGHRFNRQKGDSIKPANQLSNTEIRSEIQGYQSKIADPSFSAKDKKIIKLEFLALAREIYFRKNPHQKFPRQTQLLSLVDYIFQGTNVGYEIPTGQGKSLIAALMASLVWLEGKSVDMCTSDMVLAKRDLDEHSAFFEAIGAPYALIQKTDSIEAYLPNGIHYSSVSDMALFQLSQEVKGNAFQERALVVDEFDFAALDNTSLFKLSRPLVDPKNPHQNLYEWIYGPILRFVEFQFKHNQKTRLQDIQALRQYLLGPESSLSAEQKRKIEMNLISNQQLNVWIDAAAKAQFLKKDDGYVVWGEGEHQKVFVKMNSRVDMLSRYQGGVHEFLEVKEGVKVALESESNALRSVAQFIKQYGRNNEAGVVGFTGTYGSWDEAQELCEEFKMRGVRVPPHTPSLRITLPKQLIQVGFFSGGNFPSHHKAILREIERHQKTGQPVIVFFPNAFRLRLFHQFCSEKQINHTVLTGSEEDSQHEADCIEKAGNPNQITLTTEIMGRGTDIKSSHEKGVLVIQAAVIMQRHARQIDGRAARGDQPGSTVSIVHQMDFNKLRVKVSQGSLDKALVKAQQACEAKLRLSRFQSNAIGQLYELYFQHYRYLVGRASDAERTVLKKCWGKFLQLVEKKIEDLAEQFALMGKSQALTESKIKCQVTMLERELTQVFQVEFDFDEDLRPLGKLSERSEARVENSVKDARCHPLREAYAYRQLSSPNQGRGQVYSAEDIRKTLKHMEYGAIAITRLSHHIGVLGDVQAQQNYRSVLCDYALDNPQARIVVVHALSNIKSTGVSTQQLSSMMQRIKDSVEEQLSRYTVRNTWLRFFSFCTYDISAERKQALSDISDLIGTIDEHSPLSQLQALLSVLDKSSAQVFEADMVHNRSPGVYKRNVMGSNFHGMISVLREQVSTALLCIDGKVNDTLIQKPSGDVAYVEHLKSCLLNEANALSNQQLKTDLRDALSMDCSKSEDLMKISRNLGRLQPRVIQESYSCNTVFQHGIAQIKTLSKEVMAREKAVSNPAFFAGTR